MHFKNAGNFQKDVWREEYGGTVVLKKIQTKEARGGVGVEGLSELGEGRKGNCTEPLEKSSGLELERREGLLAP